MDHLCNVVSMIKTDKYQKINELITEADEISKIIASIIINAK